MHWTLILLMFFTTACSSSAIDETTKPSPAKAIEVRESHPMLLALSHDNTAAKYRVLPITATDAAVTLGVPETLSAMPAPRDGFYQTMLASDDKSWVLQSGMTTPSS